MDELQQLKQLVSADIPSLSKYYRGMAEAQGAGVLVVNYYTVGEVAQMEARFLTLSQIPRLSRQMGLPNLQAEFEQHDRSSEMVVALVTAETKGAIALELQFPTQGDEPEIPPTRARADTSKAKSQSSATTTRKRTDSAKTTTQRQAKNKPNASCNTKTPNTRRIPKPCIFPTKHPTRSDCTANSRTRHYS
ncbi:MAG: hypothetical protein N4J56_006656 [Chroococcidiopsis sp. SAG 2025]|nr:hypothetical protein [Chroococcidiopsis sp. SAG 2025]